MIPAVRRVSTNALIPAMINVMFPSITVVLPVRNGMPFLAEALDSVWTQQYPRLQVVVVDDGSTDATREFLAGPHVCPVELIGSRGHGPSAARNTGLCAARADLVAFLDADDLWPPHALRSLVHALASDSSSAYAQGRLRSFHMLDSGEREFTSAPYRSWQPCINLWRRGTFDRVGLFDTELHIGEDLDLMVRCWEQDIRKSEIDQVVLHYRRHPDSLTHGLTVQQSNLQGVYKRRIDRIRRGEHNPLAPKAISLDRYVGAVGVRPEGSFDVALY